jgi:hypothetical protein
VTDDEIEELVQKDWRKGYEVKVLQIIRHGSSKLTMVIYKVKCLRDGMTEWRCKGWGNAGGGWDYVTRRKW